MKFDLKIILQRRKCRGYTRGRGCTCEICDKSCRSELTGKKKGMEGDEIVLSTLVFGAELYYRDNYGCCQSLNVSRHSRR